MLEITASALPAILIMVLEDKAVKNEGKIAKILSRNGIASRRKPRGL